MPSFVRAGVVVIVRDDDNDDNTTGGAGPEEGGGAGGMICFERLLEGIFILICYCRILQLPVLPW